MEHLPDSRGSSRVAAELLRGGEMDRVEHAKLGRQQRTGGGEDPVADPDQLQPREHLPAATDSWLTKRKQRSGHLGPRERARDERSPPAQVVRKAADSGSPTASLTIAEESR
jgi:hypothetical protein